ncbi:DNA-directed RNA polymerase subunit A' [Candidatus Pacearchaeota archaeon ex4484_31]|nr:MAG: DNA-directed RNA polymerase subunit A' [Candidatus Pacearchaeota archaeon ex4484_31]
MRNKMKPIVKQIKEIQFSVISPEQIKKIAAKKIVTPELYDLDGYPVDGGLMDLHLGAIGPGIRCRTCGGILRECPGHFGYLELARPVLHVKFMPLIELCLKTTCPNCGRIMISEKELKELEKEKNTEKIVEKAKKAKKCPYCNATKEKVKIEKPTTVFIGKKRLFPVQIREWLEKIPDDDCKLLGINPKACRPEWAVLTLLLVPPVTARPSIILETGEKSEDDLTHKLSDIVRANQRLWENLNAGAPEVVIEDLWDLLQYHVTTYFDNTLSQVPVARHRSGQPLKTIVERIKGKEGRIRHNLAGKRVNFSSRTVVSPDPFIQLNEVGVPLEVAENLTVPEKVTKENIERLKELIKKESYPKALSIIRPDGKRKKITEDTKEQILEELDVGYAVERQLQDGDIVLFNRHPSLHRMSIMGHFVKILPGRTFRIHPGVCFPYNADFDGDEMNIHVPQTEEARAEAKILLNVNQHLISPKFNANVIGCVEDAITGLYLLTSAKEISKEDATQLLAQVNCFVTPSKEKLSGKEVFSYLLPKIDFEARNRACKGKACPYFEKCKKENCPNNAYVKIKNGKLVSGTIDGKIIGVETNTLIRELDRSVGREKTMEFLRKAFLLGVIYLTRTGFTVSLSDLKTTKEVEEKTRKIIEDSERKAKEIIESYYKGTLEIIPGKTLEESREIKLLQLLNEVRTLAGKALSEVIEKDNPAYIMTACGSRGSLLFLTQMACVVGQQSLWAKRISLGYSHRTLSFFKPYDLSPRARGFIYSNYLKGLEPDEFFFTAITGRDGLMDTALRTPKSGYLYRRLLNALQDLRIEYDGTVRDSNYNIIQFKYGEDGVAVEKAHLEEKQATPGDAVGVVTAESFGEPSTQMTLNVFHFAGVSEMQITLGLPRLIEIFDARKRPSTPSMEIYLEKEYNNKEGARKIAAKIKEIKLKDVAKEIDVNFSDGKINIIFNKKVLSNLNLRQEKIIEAIKSKKIKVRKTNEGVEIKAEKLSYKQLYKLKEKLKDIHIAGIKGITQVLPVKRKEGYVILTAGSNLKEVLKVKGVDKRKTITNDFYEIQDVLGIEAARQAIVNEVKKVIEKQGQEIDIRHIKLVADVMTQSGTIKGVTRSGIIEDKNSVLARASFETPIKHFINASITGSTDHLVSVIENLIFNQPVPVGTGLPGLLVKVTKPELLVRS